MGTCRGATSVAASGTWDEPVPVGQDDQLDAVTDAELLEQRPTCVFTVAWVRTSRSAISSFDRLCATSSSTSCSRGEIRADRLRRLLAVVADPPVGGAVPDDPSSAPNTWVRVLTSTAILVVAALLALALTMLAGRAPRAAGAASVAAALVFSLPFWAGGAIVLGLTAYALNRRERRYAARVGAAPATAQALFLLVPILIDFSPGLPS